MKCLAGFKPQLKTSANAEKPSSDSRWTQGRQIGEGQYGKVYLAKVTDQDLIESSNLKNPFLAAVKVIDLSGSGEVKKRAEKEYKLLRSASLSPNVVKYLAHSSPQNSKLFILLELMDLGSLDAVSKGLHKAFPEAADKLGFAKAICVQLLLGLLVLHEWLHVIHRDVKLKNVLVNSEGRVKLCDFDCGFDCSEHARKPETVLGTDCTMAPEVLHSTLPAEILRLAKARFAANAHSGGPPAQEGEGMQRTGSSDGAARAETSQMCRLGTNDSGMELAVSSEAIPDGPLPTGESGPVEHHTSYTNKCDIWSAGVVLFELAVGRQPYTFHEVKDLHMKGLPWQSVIKFDAVVDDGLRDLLRHMLCDDPDARWSAGQCLSHYCLQNMFHAEEVTDFDTKCIHHLKEKNIIVNHGPTDNLHQLASIDKSTEIDEETKRGVKKAVRQLMMKRQQRAVDSLKLVLEHANFRSLAAGEAAAPPK
jgi:serine/threonine protein kinase